MFCGDSSLYISNKIQVAVMVLKICNDISLSKFKQLPIYFLQLQALIVLKLQGIQWKTFSIALFGLLARQNNREKLVPRVVEQNSFSRLFFNFS